MGRSQKQKGSAYERNVCRRLSLWVTNLTYKDVFWRSAMSGGRATVMRKSHEVLQGGDVTAVHQSGHSFLKRFTVECKHKKDFGFLTLIFNNGYSEVLRLWDKAVKDCVTGTEPFFIIKQDRMGELIGTTIKGRRILLKGVEHSARLPLWAYFQTYDLCFMRARDVFVEVDWHKVIGKKKKKRERL